MLPGFAEHDGLAAELRQREALQTVLDRKALTAAGHAAGDPVAAGASERSAPMSFGPRLLARLAAFLRPTTVPAKA